MSFEDIEDDCVISLSDKASISLSPAISLSDGTDHLERISSSHKSTDPDRFFLNPLSSNSNVNKLASSHKDPSILSSSVISLPLLTNFKSLLKNGKVDVGLEVTQFEDSFSKEGLVLFLKELEKYASKDFNNQFTRLVFLIIQFDLLNVPTFKEKKNNKISSKAKKLIDEFCLIFETSDKTFLYEVYLNLKLMVLQTFADKFSFKKYYVDQYVSFYDLDCQLRSFILKRQELEADILNKLSNISLEHNALSKLETIGYVGKCYKDNRYQYVWEYEGDDDVDVLGRKCSKLSDPTFECILENIDTRFDDTVQLDYKLHGSLLNVPAGFQQITQKERLSLNCLSQFASRYIADYGTKEQVLFGHRGVMTKLITLVNNKKAPMVKFRAYKSKGMLFFQPVEKAISAPSLYSSAYKPVLSGFGFEHLMTKDAETGNNANHYIFNKCSINGLNFVIQAEVDVANVDPSGTSLIPFELKCISAQNFNNIHTRNDLYLKAWAQNYLVSEDALTLIGVRTPKFTLKECHVHTQSNLLHRWKETIKDDDSVILKDAEIHKKTAGGLYSIFSKVSKLLNKRDITDSEILMYEFAVKADKESGAINCSNYTSFVYDLSDNKKYTEVEDVLVKEDLRDIFTNMSYS